MRARLGLAVAVALVVGVDACGSGDGAQPGEGADASADTGSSGLDSSSDSSRDVPGDVSDASEAADASVPHGGPVHLSGRSVVDDGGPFVGLGASLFWAAWGYKNDRAMLENALDVLRKNGFQYFRALGVVGDPTAPDSWDGREIDRNWPDYDAVIAGVTDLAWKTYGLRVEWTIIADGGVTVPTDADRRALIDRFVAMSATRQDGILYFEIANEAFKNGFDAPGGIDELRALSTDLKSRTDIIVAASSPASSDCPGALEIYGGDVADLATIHFDRDVSGPEDGWRAVRQPWWALDCAGLPTASNDEPVGPGSSVSTENDPEHLVAAPLVTWISGLPLHVFHSKAGVRGDVDLSTMPGIDAFAHLHEFVPPDLPSWTRNDARDADSPFQIFAGDASGVLQPDMVWPDVPGATSGVVRALGASKGDEFFVVPFGILGKATLAARRPMDMDEIAPRTGFVVRHLVLAKDQRFDVSGEQVTVLRGHYN